VNVAAENITKIDPVTTFVRGLDGGPYYMVREASELLGVNHRVLRKLNDDPESDLKPSFLAFLGKVKVYLYTEDDIAKIREGLDERRRVYPNDPTLSPVRGRPRRFTKEDRKARQKLYSRAHYYGVRAQEELDKGQMKKASEYLSKQRAVKKELKDWHKIERPSASPTKSPSTETEAGSSSSTAAT
jgi:hypothetical protein